MVKKRVVLTAAHVVFNDANLSFVTGVNWFFQRYQNPGNVEDYEPPPQIPRGWYVFDGYAAARTNDNNPGVSSPASQNLDMAALYFAEDAGRGGFSGYLVSNPGSAEWLQAGVPKTLIGYPVEGPVIFPGRMYATTPGNRNFIPVANRVFSTTDILGYPGMSGGPLCVQFTTNNASTYYPVAIFLGGSGQTIVRAIDGAAADLINRAELTSYTGGNSTGGGVIVISPNFGTNVFGLGYMQVRLGPPLVLPAGGAWRVPARNIGYTSDPNLRIPLAGGPFSIEFKAVPGWLPPTNQPTIISPDQVIILDENYQETGPSLSYGRTEGLRLFGSSGLNYRIDSATSLAPTNWTVLTNLTLSGDSQGIGGTLPTKVGNRFFRAARP